MSRMDFARTSILVTAVTTASLAGAPLGAAPTAPTAHVAAPIAFRPHAARDPAQVPRQQTPQDPADSLYAAARGALTRSDYRRAAQLFGQIAERHPSSTYAGDALYWEAFARFRLGTEEELRRAIQALERQAAAYPQAATRGDAQTLVVRINGTLAQRGDAEAAEEIAAKAAEMERSMEAASEAAREAARDLERVARSGLPGGREDERDPSCPEDPDREVRIAALNALAQMDAERALPILRQVLERDDPCSADLRRSAVFVVSRTRSPEAEAILVETASSDPHPSVRERAVRSLANVDTESAVAALEGILRGSGDAELQEAALYALARQRSEQAGRILREFAQRDDVEPDLRERAIRSIGRRRSPEDVEFLRRLFAGSSSEAKEWIVNALAEMEDASTERWLLDIARSGAEPLEVRERALYEAGTHGAPIEELVLLYDAMPEKELKSRLISVYRRRDETAAVDKLIDIARHETDVELRTRAIRALARSEDPRVAQVLREIIGT